MSTPLPQSIMDNLNPEIPQSRPLSDETPEKVEAPSPEKFKPGWRFMAAFGSLCVITLMAALDATSISVALPVRLQT